jgi:prepilin-type N-terminal cleavage/methylation domain-containing protein
MGIKNYNLKRRGFTIIELLIVVSVIAILATITAVSYGAIQTKTKTNALKSDLSGAASQLASDLYAKNAYPATLADAANGDGVKVSNGATLTYSVNNSSSPKTFCITGTNGAIIWRVDQTNTVSEGACGTIVVPDPDPTPVPTPVAVTPTRVGYTNDYSSNGADFTITPSSTIPVGSWMIAVLVYTNNNPIDTPSGWTQIMPQQTANSLRSVIFAKIKTASDSQPFAFHASGDQSSLNATIMWGSGAQPVANWIVGTAANRSTNGTSTTNVAPSVSAPTKSLVLTISTERTTADETNITSLSNATPWFFTPQTSAKIQTVSVSYTEPSAALTTSPVTITYPNTQATNGTALQVAIPAVNP